MCISGYPWKIRIVDGLFVGAGHLDDVHCRQFRRMVRPCLGLWLFARRLPIGHSLLARISVLAVGQRKGTRSSPIHSAPPWKVNHIITRNFTCIYKILIISDTNIDDELGRMKEHHQRMSDGRKEFSGMFTGSVMKPLGISLGLMLFQQTTGINAIIFYTVSIFQTAGSSIDDRHATIIVGAVQLVFTVASGFLVGYFIVSLNQNVLLLTAFALQQVDRCGRRVLFLSSAITTAVPLAAMGTFFYFQRQWGDAEASKSLGWLPLVSLIVFFVTYSGGMSNVPFIIMGEMFPSRFRPLLGAISSSFNLFCLFLTVYFFPEMLQGLGKDGTFYFYTGCTLASVVLSTSYCQRPRARR